MRALALALALAVTLVLTLTGCQGTETSGPSPVPTSSSAVAPDPDEDTSDRTEVNASIERLLGDYPAYEDTIETFRSAVADEDVEAVADLVRYPLDTTVDGSATVIADADELTERYDEIISPATAQLIAGQQYADLLVSQEGVMFGAVASLRTVCLDDTCSESEIQVVSLQPTD